MKPKESAPRLAGEQPDTTTTTITQPAAQPAAPAPAPATPAPDAGASAEPAPALPAPDPIVELRAKYNNLACSLAVAHAADKKHLAEIEALKLQIERLQSFVTAPRS